MRLFIAAGVKNSIDSLFSRESSIRCTSQPSLADIEWYLRDVWNNIKTDYTFGDLLWVYHSFELFAQVHHDMFYPHNPGVTLSLNKGHRWLWPDILQAYVGDIIDHKKDLSHKDRWLLPQISYVESNCFSWETITKLDGSDDTVYQIENSKQYKRAQRTAAQQFSLNRRGTQRKTTSSRRAWREAREWREEEERTEKQAEISSSHLPRPEFRYEVSRDDVLPNKLISNWSPPGTCPIRHRHTYIYI